MRRSFVPSAVAGLLLAAVLLAGPVAGEERGDASAPEPLPFCAAVKSGALQVESLGSADGRRVNVRLTNRGKETLVVDLCGGVLAPAEARACSRLILGPPLESETVRASKPGQVVVVLAPGVERSLLLQTCCLDVGLPLVRRQRLVASGVPERAPLPGLMRWWAEFPTAPQSVVNAAVWTGRDRVLLDPKYGTPALAWGRGRLATAVAAHRRTVYQLVEGRLTSLDAAGTRCDLLCEVAAIVAERDALYAVFPISDWQAELRRLAHDDEKATWELTAYLSEDDRVSRVLALDGGGALLLTNDAILRLTGSSPYPERLLPSAGPGGIRIDTNGQATLLLTRRPPGVPPYSVLYAYDPAKTRLSDPQAVKGLRHLRVGAAGAYAIDPQGQLVRVVGEKRVQIGDLAVLRSVVTVGRHVVWVRGAGGGPFAVDPDTGREVARPPDMLDARDQDLVLDQSTGDLVGLFRDTYFRWSATGGPVETFPAPL